MDSQAQNSLKVCLVGPTQSGKTRFAQFLGTTRTREEYGFRSTLGVNLDILIFQGTLINLWDIGSIYLGLGEEYTKGAHGILLFHDNNNTPPPFRIPQGVPIVDVYPFGRLSNGTYYYAPHDVNPMHKLLNLINANQ